MLERKVLALIKLKNLESSEVSKITENIRNKYNSRSRQMQKLYMVNKQETVIQLTLRTVREIAY